MLYAKTIGYRDLERTRASTQCLDYAHHFFRQVITRAIIERHFSALARKHLAQRRANSARATSYECTLSFEQQTHSYSLPTRDTALVFQPIKSFEGLDREASARVKTALPIRGAKNS